MASSKKQTPLTPEERKHNLSLWRWDRGTHLAREAVKWSSICVCVCWVAECAVSFAGKITDAKLGLTGDLGIDVKGILPWIISVASVGWAVWERQLRRAVIQSLGKRNGELERIVDRRRSSSRLTSTGDTNPERKP